MAGGTLGVVADDSRGVDGPSDERRRFASKSLTLRDEEGWSEGKIVRPLTLFGVTQAKRPGLTC